MRAYNPLYLDDVMASLGAMFDYAVNSCGEPLPEFYARFLSSSVAGNIAAGNPRYLCGLSGVELAERVADTTGKPLPEKRPYIDMGSPEYWTGWTLAYIQWYMNVGFKRIDIMDLYNRYSTLHEADLSKSIQFASKALHKHVRPLKEARKDAHMTQEKLADLSGVSLRLVRAYEQGQLSLSNAGAEGLGNICKVLGCPMDRLLES